MLIGFFFFLSWIFFSCSHMHACFILLYTQCGPKSSLCILCGIYISVYFSTKEIGQVESCFLLVKLTYIGKLLKKAPRYVQSELLLYWIQQSKNIRPCKPKQALQVASQQAFSMSFCIAWNYYSILVLSSAVFSYYCVEMNSFIAQHSKMLSVLNAGLFKQQS